MDETLKLCLLFGTAGLIGADICPKSNYYGFTTYVYCSGYCCSSYATSEPCCSHSVTINLGAISGAVSGCLFIIVIVLKCCLCSSSSSEDVSPRQDMNTVTMITTTANQCVQGQTPYVYSNIELTQVTSSNAARPPKY